MKFCWATVHVKDMEDSLRFYQQIVGLKLNRRADISGGRELAFLGEGETQLELICDPGAKIEIGKDISLGFETESLDETMKFLDDKGVPVHSGPVQPNPRIRFLYVLDPDGLRVQFVEGMEQAENDVST
ncbi:MAG: VOC family protein [Chitinispirillaceae bacterium]